MDKFFDYFDGRHRDLILNKPGSEDGPVITLSRLTGCDARQVAATLVDESEPQIWNYQMEMGR